VVVGAQDGVTAEQLAEGLVQLGYALEPTEVARLVEQLDLDADGRVENSEFLASQIDWQNFQNNYRWALSARQCCSFGSI
jgi:hypothetical protein